MTSGMDVATATFAVSPGSSPWSWDPDWTGKSTVDFVAPGEVSEAAVEYAVRQWLGRVPENVPPKAVAYTRNAIREFARFRKNNEQMPTVSSVDEAIGFVRERCGSWSFDQFACWMAWLKDLPEWSDEWPARIIDTVADDLPRETFGGALLYNWKLSSNPQQHLLTSRWRELFNRAGYVEDDGAAERPTSGLVVLYRGSSWDTRANWSWTNRFIFANWFRHYHGGPRGMVWVALVPQENILARDRYRWGSNIHVVDTMRKDKPGFTIPIRPLDMWVRGRHWPGCTREQADGRCWDCGAIVQRDGATALFGETVEDAFLNRRPRIDVPRSPVSVARTDARLSTVRSLSKTAWWVA